MSETTLWPITAWMVGSGDRRLSILTVAALGERDAWSARVRRTIPRNPLLRLAAFLFYTGSAGGIAWCVLMFAATMLAARAWRGFTAGASGSTELVERLRQHAHHLRLRVVLLPDDGLSPHHGAEERSHGQSLGDRGVSGMAVCLVPYLVAFFVERNWWSVLPWYLLGSPLVLTMTNEAAKDAAGPVVIGWLVLGVLLSAPWAIGQWRRFVPL